MGTYIDLGNDGFASDKTGTYVDKTGLIAVVNKTINTKERYSCVSRCRRFGKSMAARMLQAYYDRSCDSRSLFDGLEIAGDPTFEEHLNKYPVIFLDVTNFTTRDIPRTELVPVIQQELKEEVLSLFPKVTASQTDDLMAVLVKVCSLYKEKFIFIIDEWDAILRELRPTPQPLPVGRGVVTSDTENSDGKSIYSPPSQGGVGGGSYNRYSNFLRRLFKGSNTTQVFAAVYMTGILPIKKYNTESALNNFIEYSVVKPGDMARYFGFTKDEVRMLAADHGLNFDELEKWYDGYQIGDEPSMFNPNSVMMAIREKWCESYWGRTGAYDNLAGYIRRNYDGLKDDIIDMLGGGSVPVNITKFQNDMAEVTGKDDVLTVLIHLGYLGYDRRSLHCYVPNYEVSLELKNAVEDTGWTNVVQALQQSQKLLDATLAGNSTAVAQAVDAAHDENTSILSYNDENSLACVLSIAFYSARGSYHIHREFPTGKGYADLVMIPRKNEDKPALVIELKSNRGAKAAISQIRRKEYPAKIAEYTGQILLVGINYDKKKKRHTCRIEKWEKE